MAQASDFTYFNRAGMRDNLNALLLAVPPADLLEFCAANDAIQQVCQDKKVMQQYRAEWNEKIRKDLEYLNQNEITKENPRLTQDLLLTNAAMIDAVDILEEYPDVLTDANLQQQLIEAGVKYSSVNVLVYLGENSKLKVGNQSTGAYILYQCLQQKKFDLLEQIYYRLGHRNQMLSEELILFRNLMAVNYPLADRILTKDPLYTRNLMNSIAKYGSLESYLRHLAKVNRTIKQKDRPRPTYLKKAVEGRNYPIMDYYFQQGNQDILPYLIDDDEEDEEANALFIKYEAVYPGDPVRLIGVALRKQNQYILSYLLLRYPNADMTEELMSYLDQVLSTDFFQDVEKQLVYDRQAIYDWAIDQQFFEVADFLAKNYVLKENTDPRIEEYGFDSDEDEEEYSDEE